MFFSLSWTLQSSCVFWTTFWNSYRSVCEDSGRVVAFPFSPSLGCVCVCLPARLCSGACFSPFNLICWSELAVGSHLSVSCFQSRKDRGKFRKTQDSYFTFVWDAFSCLRGTQIHTFGNSFTLSSYFCCILSSSVCCWVGGKIKATRWLIIPFRPHSGI